MFCLFARIVYFLEWRRTFLTKHLSWENHSGFFLYFRFWDVFSLSFLLLFKYSCLHFPLTTPPTLNPPPLWLCPCVLYTCILGFFKRFYLLVFRQRGREGKREGEKHQCVIASCTPCWGPGLQPRDVLWLGIEPATLWFTSWCPVNWTTPTRAES